MSTATILMVAEKPSIAQAIAGALSGGNFTKRKGISPSAPVFELQGTFPAGDQRLAAHINARVNRFENETENWIQCSNS